MKNDIEMLFMWIQIKHLSTYLDLEIGRKAVGDTFECTNVLGIGINYDDDKPKDISRMTIIYF